jgi:hypothetical protein
VVIQATMVQGAGGVTAADDAVLWATNSTGQLKLALREGQGITGLPGLVTPGTQHGGTGEMAISNAGQVLSYGATLLVDGVHATANDDRVVEIGSGDAPFTVVAREGRQAPELPAGILFGNSFGEGRIGADGKIALLNQLTGSVPGTVTGDNDSALFYGAPDDLHLMVREGSQAPGFAPGANIGSWSASGFMVNDVGTFVLLASVTDGADFNSTALFATDPSTGLLGPIVKRGDALETAPGVFKEISNLDVTLSHNQQTLNNRNELLFSATFVDGSRGLFIANLAAVPEPASWLLVAVGSLVLAVRRRR